MGGKNYLEQIVYAIRSDDPADLPPESISAVGYTLTGNEERSQVKNPSPKIFCPFYGEPFLEGDE